MHTFSTDRVAALTGLSYRQLDYGCRIGLFDVEGRGSGSQRRWTTADVRRAIAYARLRRFGVGLADAARVLDDLGEGDDTVIWLLEGARLIIEVPTAEELAAAAAMRTLDPVGAFADG